MTDPAAHPADRVGPADRLWLAALLVLALTPAIMVVWRQAAVAIFPLLALLLVAAVLRAGKGRHLAAALREELRRPLGIATVVALAYMGASITWAINPDDAASRFQDVLLTVLVAAVLLTAARLLPARAVALALPLGLAIAALLLLANAYTDSAVNAWLGRGDRASHLNRAANAIVVFLPLAAALLFARGQRLAAVALVGLAAVAVMGTQSWASRLVLVLVLLAAPLALRWPLAMHRLLLAAIVVSILTMPVLAGRLNALIPDTVHAFVGYSSLTIRGEAWQEYAALVHLRPILGFGLQGARDPATTFASPAMATVDPALYAHAQDLNEHQRMLLSFLHPHNLPLQVWVDLGAVGAAFAILLVVLVFRRMERLAPPFLPAATLAALALFVIACVGYGAWTAWWLGFWALVALAFRLGSRAHEATGDQAIPKTSR
ncbi:MAG: O-antigen ligase family protein [Pseudomonadota bacterium]